MGVVVGESVDIVACGASLEHRGFSKAPFLCYCGGPFPKSVMGICRVPGEGLSEGSLGWGVLSVFVPRRSTQGGSE